MNADLDQLLESIDPLDPAAWAVLGDWYLERGVQPAPAALPPVAGVRAAARWRLGFVTDAALEFALESRPGLYELQPLLRDRAFRLTTEVRVGARVDNQTMFFGPNPVAGGRPGLTARQLEAVLASAPPALHTLVVWQTTDPTTPATLEPLARQRPLSARRLVLRAGSQVLLELGDRIAEKRWQTITLRSRWRPEELVALDELAARHRDVQFELVGPGPRRTPNLCWVSDPDALTVSSEGQSWTLTPDSPMPPALTSALWRLGVVLRRFLGAFELARDPSLTERAVVEIDGAALVAPLTLGPGLDLQVRADDPGRSVRTFGSPGGVMFIGMNPVPRSHSARLVFTR